MVASNLYRPFTVGFVSAWICLVTAPNMFIMVNCVAETIDLV